MNLVTLIALVAGIGGLALGWYSYSELEDQTEDTTEPAVHRIYFANASALYTTTSEDSFAEIPGLAINFQVEAGEKVYFLFTCRASIDYGGGINEMSFRVTIDGEIIPGAACDVGFRGGSGTLPDVTHSVAIQHSLDSLAAGSYTLTVETSRSIPGFISNCALLVQTYS